ncbi:MAG: kynureninase [Bdellovibrionia bacterium]
MLDLKLNTTEEFAQEMDRRDPLKSYRELFSIPHLQEGQESIYFTGNSLGLQPKKVKLYVEQEIEDWAKLGVEGHFHARTPWLSYHETLTEQTARLVGAKPIEVVVMNTLTVNLHLMMVTFYRPTASRHKILIEAGAFPSDQYGVASQIRFHGFDPKQSLIELKPREGEDVLRHEDIMKVIEEQGSSIALILLGNTQYLTGQAFDIPSITKAGHAQGCQVGFDLAHGVGNLKLELHRDGPDFAVWCSYKYLNAGPGALAGCFVHERHSKNSQLPRFSGWWGQNKETRFQMKPEFDPIPGAEGWQLSNPPIFQMASLRASMEIFDEVGMSQIRSKSDQLTGYLEYLLSQLPSGYCNLVTPRDPLQRASQLSLRVQTQAKALQQRLQKCGIICDFREPNIVRVAPTALYNRYSDVYRLFQVLDHDAKNPA